jgi:hypothetical protein
MQAYKVKGRIDESGRLILDNAIELQPGEVEVIVLQPRSNTNGLDAPIISEKPRQMVKTNAFRDLLETAQPVPDNFDPDQARWEALKEK